MARILLVDDEKVARALYGDYLTGGGHEVTAVNSANAAKDALAQRPFDAVVTDLILPDSDGMEVLRHTKENHPGTEVLVITALDKVDPAVRAIKSGAAEYLVKPVAPEALLHALSRALTGRQLLRENASLRQYVSLLETGQRIATTLERDRLIQTTMVAFSQLTEASAMLLYIREPNGQFSFQASHGADDDGPLREFFDKRLKSGAPDAGGMESLPGYENALVFPAEDSDLTWGFVVLLFKGPVPPQAAPAAIYLARHLGLGLRNLGRFAEVEDLVYLDDLTHLFNFRYLQLILDREVKAAQQLNRPFSVLFLDLDYFKSVNDTHGHLIGSKLLVETSRIIKGCVRDDDVVCRYGGDEYVILLRSTDAGGALKVAERIRRTVEQHHFLAREGFSLTITTCIGVASFPEHAATMQDLLDMADRAMYRGKKGSRNVIYIAAKGLEATPAARHSTTTN